MESEARRNRFRHNVESESMERERFRRGPISVTSRRARSGVSRRGSKREKNGEHEDRRATRRGRGERRGRERESKREKQRE
eukprot:1251462-Pleurochrysis_carterae.AAC.2